MTLSGGMKRRVLIAKALSHEPQILFLDEPTAGVDVELRKDMWEMVRALRGLRRHHHPHHALHRGGRGDGRPRSASSTRARSSWSRRRHELMRKLGKKQLTLQLHSSRSTRIPAELQDRGLALSADGSELIYTYDTQAERTGITTLLQDLGAAGINFRDLSTTQSSLEDIFVNLVKESQMNLHAVRAIYLFEMARTWRTLMQSILSPVLSTSLYFVVFGAAIGSRIAEVDGVSYGAFIVPGLIMLSLLTQSIANASFGIYFPKFVGTIYELLSAPISPFEIVLGYVGAAATKSIILGLIILATARPVRAAHIAHPFWMLAFLVLTAVTFSLFGFIIGVWADSFEKLQVIPLLIITPLTFLGGSFYSVEDAAAGLADDHAVQSGRLSDQRLPLELLRGLRRERRAQSRHDVGIPRRLPRRRVVDFPHGLPAQGLKGCRESRR